MSELLDRVQRENNTRGANPTDVNEVINYARTLESAAQDRLNWDFEQAEQPRPKRRWLLLMLLIAVIITSGVLLVSPGVVW